MHPDAQASSFLELSEWKLQNWAVARILNQAKTLHLVEVRKIIKDRTSGGNAQFRWWIWMLSQEMQERYKRRKSKAGKTWKKENTSRLTFTFCSLGSNSTKAGQPWEAGKAKGLYYDRSSDSTFITLTFERSNFFNSCDVWGLKL